MSKLTNKKRDKLIKHFYFNGRSPTVALQEFRIENDIATGLCSIKKMRTLVKKSKGTGYVYNALWSDRLPIETVSEIRQKITENAAINAWRFQCAFSLSGIGFFMVNNKKDIEKDVIHVSLPN